MNKPLMLTGQLAVSRLDQPCIIIPANAYDQLTAQGAKVTDLLVIHAFLPQAESDIRRFTMEPSMTFDNWMVYTQLEEAAAVALLWQVTKYWNGIDAKFVLPAYDEHNPDTTLLIDQFKYHGIDFNQLMGIHQKMKADRLDGPKSTAKWPREAR